MDDKRFDHIVKNKLESLQPPPYRDEAWKALDYRLDLLAPLPWYSRWKSLLIAGGLGVITLLNIGLLYKVDSEQEQLKQLVALLNERDHAVKTDTVFITSESYLGGSFLDNPGHDGLAMANTGDYADFLNPLTVYKIAANVGTPPVSRPTVANNVDVPVKNNSSDFSLVVNRQLTELPTLDPFDDMYQLNAPAGDDMFVRRVVLPPSKKKWEHPINPRIGISIGYLIPDPDLGERFVTSRQSLLVETPVRGNFHLMTGLSYQELPYKLDDVDDDDNFDQAILLKYPDFETFANTPDEIFVENTMLQIPLYFRYYKPLNRNWLVFAGGGPTLDILLKQKFTYSFLDIRDEQLIEFDEIRETDDIEVNLGSISGNIGVEHYFSPRLSGQIELNYQYGLGKIGQEGRSFNSFAVSGGFFYKLNNPRGR